MSNHKTSDTPVRVKVLAEYHLFSEQTAEEWFRFIGQEVDNGESVVAEVELLYTTRGAYGLQYLFFLAEFFVSPAEEKSIKKQCRKVLNKLVYDTDIVVHNITRI